MKNIKQIILLLILFSNLIKSQVLLNSSYTVAIHSSGFSDSKFYLTKLNTLGYKYVVDDKTSHSLRIYNLNNSLYTSIQVPSYAYTLPFYYSIYGLSVNLFDLSNDIEYILQISGGQLPKIQILKEDGTIVFAKDSGLVSYISNMNYILDDDPTTIEDFIFYDGIGFKLKVVCFNSFGLDKYEVYDLPGSLPCVQCNSNENTIGIPKHSIVRNNEPIFYPNPASNQVKLKYKLPKNFKTAEINIQDVQGKLIESFKVTSDFDFIYVPSNYNNGLYLYSLVVDGAVIKTEKIVLNKD